MPGLLGDQEPRTRDVLMVVCDGLKGLPDAVNAVWEKAIKMIVHLLQLFKYASKGMGQIAKDLKPVYTVGVEEMRWTGSPTSPQMEAVSGHYTAGG